MGWVHSRKDFQFTQKWRSGPCEQRKSPSRPLFSLLRRSAASPPTGRLCPQLPRSPARAVLSVPLAPTTEEPATYRRLLF